LAQNKAATFILFLAMAVSAFLATGCDTVQQSAGASSPQSAMTAISLPPALVPGSGNLGSSYQARVVS